MDLHAHYATLLGLEAPWKVNSVDLRIDQMTVEIELVYDARQGLCPSCGQLAPIHDLRPERRWRHLDTMQMKTELRARIPRVRCEKDGVLSLPVPWAGPHSHFTLLFEAMAIAVLQACATVKGACGLLRIGWEQAQHIRERAVQRGLERRKLDEVHYLGIDEKSFGKGHAYVSILNDLGDVQKGRKARVLEVVPERTKRASKRLIKRTLTPRQRQAVKAMAMDMWPGFMSTAAELLPQAQVVHDRFHVSKHLGEAVDQTRRQEHRELAAQGDESLKGTKYLWLRGFEQPDEASRKQFKKLVQAETKVSWALMARSVFEGFWTQGSALAGESFLRQWVEWVRTLACKPMHKKATMLEEHAAGLVAYLNHPITNAVSEGFNSKIQVIKSAARGFRSFAAYRVAILFYCGGLDMTPNLNFGLRSHKV